MKQTTSPATPREARLQVVEGVAGTWFYHLAGKLERSTEALCGAQTMATHVPLSAWGTRGHLREAWCEKCAVLAADLR